MKNKILYSLPLVALLAACGGSSDETGLSSIYGAASDLSEEIPQDDAGIVKTLADFQTNTTAEYTGYAYALAPDSEVELMILGESAMTLEIGAESGALTGQVTNLREESVTLENDYDHYISTATAGLTEGEEGYWEAYDQGSEAYYSDLETEFKGGNVAIMPISGDLDITGTLASDGLLTGSMSGALSFVDDDGVEVSGQYESGNLDGGIFATDTSEYIAIADPFGEDGPTANGSFDASNDDYDMTGFSSGIFGKRN